MTTQKADSPHFCLHFFFFCFSEEMKKKKRRKAEEVKIEKKEKRIGLWNSLE